MAYLPQGSWVATGCWDSTGWALTHPEGRPERLAFQMQIKTGPEYVFCLRSDHSSGNPTSKTRQRSEGRSLRVCLFLRVPPFFAGSGETKGKPKPFWGSNLKNENPVFLRLLSLSGRAEPKKPKKDRASPSKQWKGFWIPSTTPWQNATGGVR